MKDRFPRTTKEFAHHDRRVVVRCEHCHQAKWLDPEELILTFGEDFDCYSGLAEMRSQLRCAFCGASRRIIHFHDLNEKPFGPVSF